MGDNTLNAAVDGTVIPASDNNALRTAMIGDAVPRNSSGVAADEAGSLGSTSFQWLNVFATGEITALKALIESGYWNAGDIKPHHSYNGTVSSGHGWMLCDGRIINETNYNTEHGAGSWDTYITSSSLDGLYLPNLTSRYIRGSATTTDDGTVTIPSVGNSSNSISLSHTHPGGFHVHKWYEYSNASTTSKSYNSSGVATNITNTPIVNASGHISATSTTGNILSQDYYTAQNNATTGSGITIPQDISPDSIKVQYYMRII